MQGLIIRQPWIDLILEGKKTWEMRSRPTKIRGTIALIRARSGSIVGIARLVGSEEALTHANYMRYQDRHGIPASMLDEVIASRWVYPWVLDDVRPLKTPVPSFAKPGAVTFVNLEPSVVEAIARTGLCPRSEAEDRTPRPIEPVSNPRPISTYERTAALCAGQPSEPVRGVGEEPLFQFRFGEAHAFGRPLRGKEFLVIKGSTAVKTGSARVKRDAYDRARLIEQGILVADPNPNLYRFATDWTASSASKAAGVIKDGNASGPTLWEDTKTSRSLANYKARA